MRTGEHLFVLGHVEEAREILFFLENYLSAYGNVRTGP